MDLQQEFVYVGDDAVVEPSGKSRRFGADLGIRFQPLENFYVNADINYSHARFIEEQKSEDYVPLAPVVTSTGSVNWDFYHGFSVGCNTAIWEKDRLLKTTVLKQNLTL
jgi:hypothetical protein